MFPVSSRYIDAVTNGGLWTVTAEVQEQGELVAGGEEVPITGGQFNCDINAAQRRYCTVEVAPESLTWIPSEPGDLLFPIGRELFIKAGFTYDDGTQELIPQGMFRVTKPSSSHNTGGLGVSLQAYDRSRAVSRDRFTKPYVVPAGTSYPTAIRTIVERTFPWFDDEMFQFMESNFATVQLIFDQEADPWKSAVDMADAMGAELYFDGFGRCVLMEQMDLSGADPVWTYFVGESGTILDMKADLDDERAYNGVVVTGENSSTNTPPVRAEAWDMDPDSPTYYDPSMPEASSYGPVPYFITSQFVATQAQAQAAANANLSRVTGIIQSLDFTGVPNPAHDCGDVVQIIDTDLGINQLNTLDTVSYSFGVGGEMHMTTRERRVTM